MSKMEPELTVSVQLNWTLQKARAGQETVRSLEELQLNSVFRNSLYRIVEVRQATKVQWANGNVDIHGEAAGAVPATVPGVWAVCLILLLWQDAAQKVLSAECWQRQLPRSSLNMNF